MRCAPVVLNVSRVGVVVPLASDLNGIFAVALRVAKQIVSKGVARELSVEGKVTLRVSESILGFLVDCPTGAHFDLVRTLGPGDVIAQLIVIRFIVPRSPVGSVIRDTAEVNRRNAASHVGTGEQTIKGKARGCSEDTLRDDVNAVAIVVESGFVQQRRAHHVGGVHNRAVRRITENIANRWDVIAAPLSGSIGLRSLLGDPVSENRELIVEGMVNTSNFFPDGRRRIVAALEHIGTVGRSREDPSAEKSLGVGVQQCCRNCIARVTLEYRIGNSTRTRNAAPATTIGRTESCNTSSVKRTLLRCGKLVGARNVESRVQNNVSCRVFTIRRHVADETAAVGASHRNGLIQQAALNQAAPFHVVKEERLRVVAVVEFHWTADVEAVGIEAELGNFLRSRVEVVASIESIVAVEFPKGSVELLAAGLNNFSDGSGGRKAVLSAVV